LNCRYFSDVLIEANFVLSLAPSPFMTGMIASAMRCDQSVFDRRCTGFIGEKCLQILDALSSNPKGIARREPNAAGSPSRP
jgi:hypothetical protein